MAKYLTVEETAQLLRVKKQTIYKWICERRIGSISLGGRTLFSQEELERWVEEHRREERK